MGFQGGLESIDSRSIPNVKRYWVPHRQAKIREGTITFRLALTERVFEEAGVSSGAKRSIGQYTIKEIGDLMYKQQIKLKPDSR